MRTVSIIYKRNQMGCEMTPYSQHIKTQIHKIFAEHSDAVKYVEENAMMVEFVECEEEVIMIDLYIEEMELE